MRVMVRPDQPAADAPVRRRPGGRTARVRAAVLQAAIDELAEVGYAGFNLDRVAARAGVHRTTLYRRWGTRDALVLDAGLTRAEQAVPIPDTGSAREDLATYAREIIANVSTPEMDAIVRAFASESPHNRELADGGRRFWATRFALARDIVRRGVERGELGPGVDADALLEAVLGPLYLRMLVTGGPLDEAFVQRTVDFALRGAAHG
jgi:AcrR family transcriptional regulator